MPEKVKLSYKSIKSSLKENLKSGQALVDKHCTSELQFPPYILYNTALQTLIFSPLALIRTGQKDYTGIINQVVFILHLWK